MVAKVGEIFWYANQLNVYKILSSHIQCLLEHTYKYEHIQDIGWPWPKYKHNSKILKSGIMGKMYCYAILKVHQMRLQWKSSRQLRTYLKDERLKCKYGVHQADLTERLCYQNWNVLSSFRRFSNYSKEIPQSTTETIVHFIIRFYYHDKLNVRTTTTLYGCYHIQHNSSLECCTFTHNLCWLQ